MLPALGSHVSAGSVLGIPLGHLKPEARASYHPRLCAEAFRFGWVPGALVGDNPSGANVNTSKTIIAGIFVFLFWISPV